MKTYTISFREDLTPADIHGVLDGIAAGLTMASHRVHGDTGRATLNVTLAVETGWVETILCDDDRVIKFAID